jgi:uncharacterized protein with PQ loop repeat
MHIDALALNLLGFAATGFSIFMWIPQARTTWKNRNDPGRLAGVSETTQWLTMIGYLLWGLFGVLSESYWVAAPSVVAFPLALATIFVVRRGRRLPPLVTSVSIIAIDESLSVADTTGSIPIISTGDSVAVGDITAPHSSPVTGTTTIISAEESVAVGDPLTTRSFTSTGAIPVVA